MRSAAWRKASSGIDAAQPGEFHADDALVDVDVGQAFGEHVEHR
jgi:hypothetical protein